MRPEEQKIPTGEFIVEIVAAIRKQEDRCAHRRLALAMGVSASAIREAVSAGVPTNAIVSAVNVLLGITGVCPIAELSVKLTEDS